MCSSSVGCAWITSMTKNGTVITRSLPRNAHLAVLSFFAPFGNTPFGNEKHSASSEGKRTGKPSAPRRANGYTATQSARKRMVWNASRWLIYNPAVQSHYA